MPGFNSFRRNHFLADMFPVSLFGGQFADSSFQKTMKKSSPPCTAYFEFQQVQLYQWVHFSAFACPWSTLHFYFFRHCSVDLLQVCGSLPCFRVRYSQIHIHEVSGGNSRWPTCLRQNQTFDKVFFFLIKAIFIFSVCFSFLKKYI